MEQGRTIADTSDLPDGASPILKNILLFRNSKSGVFLTPSPAHQKGVRDRHERRAGDAMDAAVLKTNEIAAYGQVVWFWRRDPGVKFAGTSRGRRWQKRPLTGKSTKYAVKPLRGDVGVLSAEPVCKCAVSCAVAHVTAGAARTPAPRALFRERGATKWQSSGENKSRDRERTLSSSSRTSEQSER